MEWQLMLKVEWVVYAMERGWHGSMTADFFVWWFGDVRF